MDNRDLSVLRQGEQITKPFTTGCPNDIVDILIFRGLPSKMTRVFFVVVENVFTCTIPKACLCLKQCKQFPFSRAPLPNFFKWQNPAGSLPLSPVMQRPAGGTIVLERGGQPTPFGTPPPHSSPILSYSRNQRLPPLPSPHSKALPTCIGDSVCVPGEVGMHVKAYTQTKLCWSSKVPLASMDIFSSPPTPRGTDCCGF